MNIVPLAVFVMGLRHGADPDHLAAIDNLTRNASERRPLASRFVGTLFAIGHSGMVIAMALLAAAAGARIGAAGPAFTAAGQVLSIAVLLAMGGANLVMLLRGGAAGARARLLPGILAKATHPIAAIPTGALFGLGFETPSQLAAYGTAFTSASWLNGLGIGAAFCAGMLCTDTLDSLILARTFAKNARGASTARRVWIGAVTCVAFGVAAQEIAAMFGRDLPLGETVMSALIVLLLVCTAVLIAGMQALRRARAAS